LPLTTTENAVCKWLVCAIVPLLTFQFHDSSLSVDYTFFDSLTYTTVSLIVWKYLLAEYSTWSSCTNMNKNGIIINRNLKYLKNKTVSAVI
jgi:hypothetical protein